MRRKIPIIVCLFLAAGSVLQAQEQSSPYDSLAVLVGLRLNDLVSRFGVPNSVYVARGDEAWQDDVVFSYTQGSFFIHRDRVWQVSLDSVPGMKVGDPAAVANLVFGDTARNNGRFFIRQLQVPMEIGWPVAIRVNLENGRIAAIFVYRTDY